MIISFISDEFKNDENLIKEAIKTSPMALEYAPIEYQDNAAIVLDAVK